MMKRMHITIKFLLLAAAVLLTGGLPSASAYDQGYDSTRTTSIAIQLPDIGTDASGVPFTCYQVGVPGEGHGLNWELRSELSQVSVSFDETMSASESQQAAMELEGAVAGLEIPHVMGTTDEQGRLVFSQLPQGIYLVVQTQTKDYGTVAPFLVAAPYGDEDHQWVYDVVTEPKAESLEEPPEEPEQDHSDRTPNRTTSEVKTGDTTQWSGYALLLGVAAVGAVLLLGTRRTKQDPKK